VTPSGKRVAVVGAGPAGLTAGYFLRRMGHGVDLFDAREEPGGLLRYAIPDYRLPAEALAWETGLILADGVKFHPQRRLGGDLGWDELGGFDAVFVAVGAWASASLGVAGEDLARDGLELLESVRRGEMPQVDGPVAVIGGGNTAVDVARTLLRLGAEPVIYYRRRVQDMPALFDEIQEATEEGIPIRPLLAPERVETGSDGSLLLHLTPMTALETLEWFPPASLP
jgi:NADPH-dependent glutamate synthase beta subunit-like oxidoreductase